MIRINDALAFRRRAGFWLVSCLAILLALVSWINRYIVRFFNIHLFHAGVQGNLDPPGWWIYLALRVPLSLALVWLVIRFPVRSPKRAVEAGTAGLRYFDPLMGLRALAFVMVFMGHYFRIVFPFTAAGMHRYLLMLLLSSPWAGVWLFFTLSGFLMGKGFASGRYSLDEKGVRLFFRNRCLRILPIYYAGLFVVSVYRYPAIFFPKNWWMAIEMGIFDYRGDLPLNPIGALWSVSTEVQFYLLVPFLTFALMKVKRVTGKVFILFPALLIVIESMARAWIGRHAPSDYSVWFNSYTYSYSPLLTNLDLFVAGMSINYLPPLTPTLASVRRFLGPALVVGAVFIYCAICFATYFWGRLFGSSPYWATAPILCIVLASVFIYLAEVRGKIRIPDGVLGAGLLLVESIGTLTYCLYVFHPEVLMINGAFLPRIHSFGASLRFLPLVAAELAGVALFFYLAVEKPLNARKLVSDTALTDAP